MNVKCLKLLSLNTMAIIKQLKRTDTSFQIEKFELNLLDQGPSTTVQMTKPEALTAYRQMASIRRMEQMISELYLSKVIRGFCHLYSGQEATAVGLFNTMSENDDLITAYRTHGFTYLLDNSEALPMLAELAGMSTGSSMGKGGSMHTYTKNFYGGNGIVGASIPLGTGLGLAHMYRNDNGVTFTLYGDGASQQGQCFEAQNIAKLWNLPVIFVCENNLFGMGTSSKRSSANPEYYRSSTYIPGVLVNGMDIFAVKSACLFAKQYVANGKGPIILEMRCYRYFGHSMSDPGTSYRTREDIQKVREKNDPIKLFGDSLTKSELVSAEEISKITADVKDSMNKIVQKMKVDKALQVEHLTNDVYAATIQKDVRGLHVFRKHTHQNVSKLPHPNSLAKKI